MKARKGEKHGVCTEEERSKAEGKEREGRMEDKMKERRNSHEGWVWRKDVMEERKERRKGRSV